MDTNRFELTMQKFFEKAGVKLFKKDIDYVGSEVAPRYVLVDEKRKSYYFANSDAYDDAALIDFEIKAVSEFVSAKNDIPEKVISTFFGLGKSYSEQDSTLNIDGVDLNSKSKKSASIITEEFENIAGSYLKSLGVTFQAVPLKGAFTVYFIDALNSEILTQEYKRSFDEYLNGSKPVTFDFNSLVGGVPPLDEHKNAPQKTINMDDLLASVPPLDKHLDEEAILDNIDLSDLLMPKATTPEPIVDEVADFTKLLLEQEMANATTHMPSDIPAPKTAKDIPSEILEELKEDVKEDVTEDENSGLLAETDLNIEVSEKDIQHAKETFYEEESIEHITPLWMKKGPGTKETLHTEEKVEPITPQVVKMKPAMDEKGKNNAKTKAEESIKRLKDRQKANLQKRHRNIYDHVCAAIFFTPIYLLNKVIKQRLPKFVTYWLASFVSVFGIYSLLAHFLAPYIYQPAIVYAGGVQADIVTTISEIIRVAGSEKATLKVLGIAEFALVFYDTYMFALANIGSTLLSKCLMPIAAIFTIFPFSRQLALQTIVYIFLMFGAIPLGTIAIANIISYCNKIILVYIATHSDNILGMIEVYSVELLMSVFALPIVLMVFIFKLSAIFVPNLKKGVLP